MNVDAAIHPYGDAALVVEFGDQITEDAYRRIRGLEEDLEADPPAGLRELIPAYTSLLIVYDPLETSYPDLESLVRSRIEKDSSAPRTRRRIVGIPVCYEPPHAPDLLDVARQAGLAPDEVVSIHAAGTYLVYMLGFTPGFPYLGGMDERIAAPRRASPRTRVPSGSVGIADRQTGIYPQESPGGWNIIGRTPVVLFDPFRQPPALLAAGLYIRFQPISAGEYEELAGAAASGRWMPEIEEVRT